MVAVCGCIGTGVGFLASVCRDMMVLDQLLGQFVDPPGGHRTGVQSPKPPCKPRARQEHARSNPGATQEQARSSQEQAKSRPGANQTRNTLQNTRQQLCKASKTLPGRNFTVAFAGRANTKPPIIKLIHEIKLLVNNFISRNQLYDWGFRACRATRANHKVAYLHCFCTISRQKRAAGAHCYRI